MLRNRARVASELCENYRLKQMLYSKYQYEMLIESVPSHIHCMQAKKTGIFPWKFPLNTLPKFN